MEKAIKQQELDAKLQVEQKEREDRLQMEKEIKLQEIEAKVQMEKDKLEKHGSSTSSSQFDATKNIRLVPKFEEKEVDKYFLHFEKIAESLKWSKESWTLLLQLVFIGKAREIYSSLSIEQCQNYDAVKKAVLKAYELMPEAYRQKLLEFTRVQEQLFDRWLSFNPFLSATFSLPKLEWFHLNIGRYNWWPLTYFKVIWSNLATKKIDPKLAYNTPN